MYAPASGRPNSSRSVGKVLLSYTMGSCGEIFLDDSENTISTMTPISPKFMRASLKWGCEASYSTIVPLPTTIFRLWTKSAIAPNPRPFPYKHLEASLQLVLSQAVDCSSRDNFQIQSVWAGS